MNEEKLIKQKLKEGKKQVKANKIKEKKESKNFNLLIVGIIAVIQVLITFAIPKDAIWFGMSMIAYMVVTTSAIINILATYLYAKNYTNDDKVKKAFFLISTITIFIVGNIRDLGFLTFFLPIINLPLGWIITHLTPNIDLTKSIDALNRCEKLAKKAVNMQLKKMILLIIVVSIICSLALGTLYLEANVENEVVLILIGSAIVAVVVNLIFMLTIKVVSKRIEKVLNAAFGLKMGEVNYVCETSTNFNAGIIYNYTIMYYRWISLAISIITLLILTKFDISVSILIASVYHWISMVFPKYNESWIYTGAGEQTVARIYDSDGNQTGSIKKWGN